MLDPVAIAAHFADCLEQAVRDDDPYTHWLLDGALPEAVLRGIDALPFQPPPVGDTLGRRETHNSTRLFFGAGEQAAFPVCAALAGALQGAGAVRAIERVCGVALGGLSLRIEYCLDTDGFWLEPHTDIGAKKFTMLIYVSDDPGSEDWGTDICAPDGTVLATTPYERNGGLIFIPGSDTWHGFHRRRIAGVRRSLIVNYVGAEWRARHELAFPEAAIA